MKTILEIWKALPFEVRAVLFAGIGFLVILTFAIGGIDGCTSRRAKNADKENQRQIEQTKGKLEITNQEKQNANIQIKKSDEAANRAASNFNHSVRRDSSTHSEDFRSARAKFCADYPDDSKCARK